MGWAKLTSSSRVNGRPLLYDFQLDRNGYVLRLTDLVNVWEETLTAAALQGRNTELGNKVDLNSSSGINGLCQTLQSILPDAKIPNGIEGNQVSELEVALTIPGTKPLQWKFVLEPVPVDRARTTVQEIAFCLYEVIATLGARTEALREVIRQKSYHIRGQAEASGRSATYVPKQYVGTYEDSFSDQPDVVPTREDSTLLDQGIDLASKISVGCAPTASQEPSLDPKVSNSAAGKDDNKQKSGDETPEVPSLERRREKRKKLEARLAKTARRKHNS